MRRQDNDRQTGMEALNFTKQRQAVHFIHAQIADHQIDLFFIQLAQRVWPAVGGSDLKPFAGQTHAQQLQQRGVIVNQQQTGGVMWHYCASFSLLFTADVGAEAPVTLFSSLWLFSETSGDFREES